MNITKLKKQLFEDINNDFDKNKDIYMFYLYPLVFKIKTKQFNENCYSLFSKIKKEKLKKYDFYKIKNYLKIDYYNDIKTILKALFQSSYLTKNNEYALNYIKKLTKKFSTINNINLIYRLLSDVKNKKITKKGGETGYIPFTQRVKKFVGLQTTNEKENENIARIENKPLSNIMDLSDILIIDKIFEKNNIIMTDKNQRLTYFKKIDKYFEYGGARNELIQYLNKTKNFDDEDKELILFFSDKQYLNDEQNNMKIIKINDYLLSLKDIYYRYEIILYIILLLKHKDQSKQQNFIKLLNNSSPKNITDNEINCIYYSLLNNFDDEQEFNLNNNEFLEKIKNVFNVIPNYKYDNRNHIFFNIIKKFKTIKDKNKFDEVYLKLIETSNIPFTSVEKQSITETYNYTTKGGRKGKKGRKGRKGGNSSYPAIINRLSNAIFTNFKTEDNNIEKIKFNFTNDLYKANNNNRIRHLSDILIIDKIFGSDIGNNLKLEYLRKIKEGFLDKINTYHTKEDLDKIMKKTNNFSEEEKNLIYYYFDQKFGYTEFFNSATIPEKIKIINKYLSLIKTKEYRFEIISNILYNISEILSRSFFDGPSDFIDSYLKPETTNITKNEYNFINFYFSNYEIEKIDDIRDFYNILPFDKYYNYNHIRTRILDKIIKYYFKKNDETKNEFIVYITEKNKNLYEDEKIYLFEDEIVEIINKLTNKFSNRKGGKAIIRNHKLKYLLKKIYKDFKTLSLN